MELRLVVQKRTVDTRSFFRILGQMILRESRSQIESDVLRLEETRYFEELRN